MNTIKSVLRRFAPASIRAIVRRVLAPYRLRRSWLARTTSRDDDHLSTYWNAEQQPNRKQLISILKDEIEYLLANAAEGISVLEYGSHVGLNLKLLGEQVGTNRLCGLYAVEPNQEAVEFLRTRLPHVRVLAGEDEAFCADHAFPPTGVYLSFVNSVFYSMEPHRVRAVMEKLGKFSKVIVIGESLANVDGNKSRLRESPECFEHPYRMLLDQIGFELVAQQIAEDPRPQLNGYLVARKKVAR